MKKKNETPKLTIANGKIKICPSGCKKHRDHLCMPMHLIKKYEAMLNEREIKRFYPVVVDRYTPGGATQSENI